jgi:hypothetical protein
MDISMRDEGMQRKRLLIIAMWALWFLPMGLLAQSSFYDIGTIQKIEIQFSQPDWDYRMDTAKAGADGYLMSDWVKINGIQYDSAGVKYKGNSSYSPSIIKNPLHIELDAFANRSHEGFTDIKLGNGYADPSLLREVLAYNILKDYMHCPRANYAQVYINGSYIGIYSNSESINKEFCSNHFYSSGGTFFKCNPTVSPGPTTKSNLQTIAGADSTGYFTRYELKSDYGWNDLVELCNVVTSNPSQIAYYLDMDRVIWMLAFNDVLVNLDSYSGAFCQNYYLYRDQTAHFNPVVWDLNMSFGGFPWLGAGPTSMNTLTIPTMQTMSPLIHDNDPNWPLIEAVLDHSRYRRMYLAHLRTLTEDVFSSGAYVGMALSYQSLIDTALAGDQGGTFTYQQFQDGLTADATFGALTIPGISNLMTARVSYLQSTPEFQFVQPSITSTQASPALPNLNATVTITANVTGADSVFLGYRLSQAEKFQRIPMFDDGAHGDSLSGDGLYGASFVQTSAQAQYYVYAENQDIGAFSPARAEHEFHTVQAAVSFPVPGDLVINEFLAVNQTGQTDESGQFEDWIELFNNSQSALSLTGLYLTDDGAIPTKCALPTGTTIPSQGLLIIWADEDVSITGAIHCNFKLSSQGEEIKLSNGNGVTLDSIIYGPQVADISFGRCPDGTGPYSFQLTPTFNALNCGVGVPEAAQHSLTVHPNPVQDRLWIGSSLPQKGELTVWDQLGRPVYASKWLGFAELDVKTWPAGIYFIRLGSGTQKVVVAH